jgi:hypothetical protein
MCESNEWFFELRSRVVRSHLVAWENSPIVETSPGRILRDAAQQSSFSKTPSFVKPSSNPKRKATPIFPHFGLLRVDAASPRLGRAFRAAPVSRQTYRPRAVWHSPRFHSRPATLPGLRSVPFTGSACFFRCRSSEEKNKPIPAEREKT